MLTSHREAAVLVFRVVNFGCCFLTCCLGIGVSPHTMTVLHVEVEGESDVLVIAYNGDHIAGTWISKTRELAKRDILRLSGKFTQLFPDGWELRWEHSKGELLARMKP